MAWLRSAVGMLLALSACRTFSDAEVSETGGSAGGALTGGAGGSPAGGAGGRAGASEAGMSGSSGQSGASPDPGGQSGGGQAGASGSGAIRILLIGGRTAPGSPGTIPAAGGFPSACLEPVTGEPQGVPGVAAGGASGFPVPYAAGKGGAGGQIEPDLEGGAAGVAGTAGGSAGAAAGGGSAGGAGAGGAGAAGSGGAAGAGGTSGSSGQGGAAGAGAAGAGGAGGAGGGSGGAAAGAAGAGAGGGAGTSGSAGAAGTGGAGAGGASGTSGAAGAPTDPNPYPSTRCIEEVVLTAQGTQGSSVFTGQVAYSSQTELAKPLSMFAVARLGGSSWALSGGVTGKVATLGSTCPYCFDLIEPASFSTLNEGVTTYRDEGNASVLEATSSYGMSVSWSVDVPGGGKMLVLAGTTMETGPTLCQYRLFADPDKPEVSSAPVVCSAEGTVPFRRGAATVVVPRLDASGQVANDGGPYGWLLLLAGKGEKGNDLAQYGQSSSDTGAVEHSIHYAPVGPGGPGAWAAADRELRLPAPKNAGTSSSYDFHLNTGIVGASAFYEPTAGLVHVAGGCLSALYVHDSTTRAYPQGAAASVQSFAVSEGTGGALVFGDVSEQPLPINRCYAASAVVGSSMLLFGGVVIGETEPGGTRVNLSFDPLDTVVQLETRPALAVTELTGVKLPRPLFGHAAVRIE